MIINNEKLKKTILFVIGDNEMVQIMNCSMYKSVSVNDIIKETGIPHTTTYRKIKWMLENGILITEKIFITEDGKKSSLFRSTLKLILIKYERNEIIVQAEYNVDPLSRTVNKFFSLDE